jgi:hypothetical protein
VPGSQPLSWPTHLASLSRTKLDHCSWSAEPDSNCIDFTLRRLLCLARHPNLAIMTSAQFQTAVEDSRKLKAKPSDDELLQVSTPLLLYYMRCSLRLRLLLRSLCWSPSAPRASGASPARVLNNDSTYVANGSSWQYLNRRLPHHVISISGYDTPFQNRVRGEK